MNSNNGEIMGFKKSPIITSLSNGRGSWVQVEGRGCG